MAGYSSFYDGNKYTLSYKEEDAPLGFKYGTSSPASQFALTTRPDTANQLREVSEKISAGTKHIEVTGITPAVLESIPEQHLVEINRLKKLAGTELTLHGPLVEPTGVVENRWDEASRKFAEKTMLSAIERGHKLDPEGNIIVTFHSSNGLPDPEAKIKTEDGEEVPAYLAMVNERDGTIRAIPKAREDYYTKKKALPEEELKSINERVWTSEFAQINNQMLRGREIIDQTIESSDQELKEIGGSKALLEAFRFSQENPEEYNKMLKELEKKNEVYAKRTERFVNQFGNVGNIVNDAYTNFKELFNQAYASVRNEEDKEKLNKFRDEVAEVTEKYKNDRSKMPELTEEISKGIRLLSSLKEPPEMYKPLRKFAIDKAAETFSNVALDSYKKFKDTAPIISIENPPVGMGLSRANELKELIEKSRSEFVEKAKKELKMSESEAKEQADKLIGITWDVGHINMLRKYGYSEKDILKETEKIAKDVKHIHLSDNFGLEHTELPMGMGNVPTKEHMDLIEQYNKNLKKIIETGSWYQHFQTSPFRETLHAFGAQVYGTAPSPYWHQVQDMQGSYFAGYGLNPEFHHATYGAGFSGLPTELGGQIPGRQSRLSGTPME